MTLGLLACIFAVAPQGSLLKKVIPLYTGKNGYEEYVQAATTLDQPESRELNAYILALGRTDEPRKGAPPGVDPSLSRLELYRLQTKKQSQVIDLIRAGNQKPVTYPLARISGFTLFPEGALYKEAARLFARAAYVKFAEGSTKEATRLILDGLYFARKIECCGLLNLLVGESCRYYLFQVIEQRQDQLGIADWDAIAAWVKEDTTSFTAAAKNSFRVEAGSIRATFDEFLENPGIWLEGDKVQEFRGTIARIPAAKRDKLYQTAFQGLEGPYLAAMQRLDRPEIEWLDPISRADLPEEQDLSHFDPDSARVGLQMLLIYTSFMTEADAARWPQLMARNVTQRNLLGLYADVHRYRWRNGRLPDGLASISGSEPVDPATTKPYRYEQLDPGFRISSDLRNVGVVTLTKIAGSNDEGVPPP